MDPYEDPRLDVDTRVDDLLARMSLAEKVGLMFHTVIEAGPEGSVLEAPGAISKSATTEVITSKHLSHFNVHALGNARAAARWQNHLQAIAETTPHGIPVTISTDPRHAFIENAGVSFAAKAFSQWPRAARAGGAARCQGGAALRRHRAAGVRGGRQSGRLCTRRSTSPPSRGGPVRPERSGRTCSSRPSSEWLICRDFRVTR